MNRIALCALVIATGCETNETSMTILNLIIPQVDTMTGGCTVDAKAESGKADAVSLDTGAALAISLPFSVSNNLTQAESDFAVKDGPDVTVRHRNEITPLRFATRFTCDTSAYSNSIANGLILPRFNPRESFCVDDRSEARAITENSDIVPASGSSIPAGGIGAVIVNAVPHELGRAVDELFDIAVLADQCCRNTDQCSGDLSEPTCRSLQDIFEAVDNTGALSAAGMAGQQNLTLRKFADYSLFDGNYITRQDVEERFDKLTTPAFPLSLHGQLEGVTGHGTLVKSNDFSVEIELCRNCGAKDPNTGVRSPAGEFGCIRR